VSENPKDCSTRSAFAVAIAWAGLICCVLPAAGETAAPSYGQAPGAQRSDPDQEDPAYNGEDFTRPERSFETRFAY
jgi:hypothetical protein